VPVQPGNPPLQAPAAPVAATAPVAVAATTVTPTPAPAVAAPKRAPVRHKVRPPTEAELKEPAKL
jgi:hypothetical protein